MPFSVVLSSVILPASVLSMTFLIDSGIQIMTTFYHMKHPLKTKKVKKPKAKGAKADFIEKVTVAELIPQLENTQFHLDEQPYASLFKIYKKEFLDVSVSKNLIHPDSLALDGDGTPVVTSHIEQKKRICDCKENGITNCKCNRYFSLSNITSNTILTIISTSCLITAFRNDAIYTLQRSSFFHSIFYGKCY